VFRATILLVVDVVKGPGRRDKARETRRRILRAAHGEFLERGYHGATIASIARRAGVATQTVYFVFHTKAELISAVIDAAVLGEHDEVPQETSWWESMLAAATAADALRAFVHGAGPLFARASAVSEVLRGAALTDPELRATLAAHDELQRTGYRQVIDALATKGALRPGLEPEVATDILLTVLGDATYVYLTTVRGWHHEAVVAWLADALPRLLLADAEG
jgi:AcrR family transcriptional regulator